MSETNSEHRIIQDLDIFSLYRGEKNEYFQNREAVDRLKAECDLLAKGAIFGASLSPSLLFVPVPISLAGLAGLTLTTEYLTRVHRLYLVAHMLLDNFSDDGIEMTLRVRTNSAIIDLLVRMPDKRIFALIVRGRENTSVKWREDRQQFFVTKKGKNAKRSDPLTRAMDELQTIVDLKKDKHPLMGITSAERNVPLMKAIVLAPGAKIAASNSPEIQTDFGESKVLKIKTTSVTYVVECDELVKFLSTPRK